MAKPPKKAFSELFLTVNIQPQSLTPSKTRIKTFNSLRVGKNLALFQIRPEAEVFSKCFAAGQVERFICTQQFLRASASPASQFYIARCNQRSENKAIKGTVWDSQTATDTNQLQEGLGTQPAKYLIFWSGFGFFFSLVSGVGAKSTFAYKE